MGELKPQCWTGQAAKTGVWCGVIDLRWANVAKANSLPPVKEMADLADLVELSWVETRQVVAQWMVASCAGESTGGGSQVQTSTNKEREGPVKHRNTRMGWNNTKTHGGGRRLLHSDA